MLTLMVALSLFRVKEGGAHVYKSEVDINSTMTTMIPILTVSFTPVKKSPCWMASTFRAQDRCWDST